MASASLARQIGALFEDGSAAGLSDRQLLERFAIGRDEAAFAALVTRHGPMVLGVCRQLLGDRQHAEDAFQAVFLVLARKAGSLREPDLLGNWLYGVALRTARKARGRLARRRRTEEAGAIGRPEARPAMQAQQVIDREQAEALHVEIDRLPGDFRMAVVLCYFEGLSPDEAAARLQWPSGTLRSRLVRARDRLRRGLARRGIVLSGAALAVALAPRSASASVSPLLCASTTRAAIAFAARHAAAGGALSAPAAALAREVLRTMMIHKLKATSLSLLLIATLAAGAGYHALDAFAGPREGEPPGEPALAQAPARASLPASRAVPPARQEPRPPGSPRAPEIAREHSATAEDAPRPDDGRMTVTGRVLRPDGKPAAGVPVDIVGTSRVPEAGTDVERVSYALLGRGTADADGRFRIEASRSSSSRYRGVYALAGAAGPGTAFGSVALHPDAERPAAEITLPPEQVIRGRLVQVNGEPAAGVEVQLDRVYSESARSGGARFDSPDIGRSYVWGGSRAGLRAWPGGVTTDAQGRFTIAGVGRGLYVGLGVHDPRYAQQKLETQTDDKDGPREVTAAVQPSTIIEGRVLAADTGRPIADAVISVRASSGLGGGMFTTKFRADGQGRFRINPFAGSYFRMRAFPPEGQPYLPLEAEFEWTKGTVKKSMDFSLRRGVLIRGKVAEEQGRGPVAGAAVQFFPRDRSGDVVAGFESLVISKDDGSFQIAVPAGEGYLLVMGPTLNFIPREIGGRKLYGDGQPGGMRFYAHDIIAYDVKAGLEPHELTATLRSGKAVKGRLLGPAGEAVDDAVILTRQQLDPINMTWKDHSLIHAHGSRFTLTGFDPEKPAPAYILDADHGWGAAVEFSGKQAGEDVAVHLRPCGQARVRFVGPDGKPVAGLQVWPYLRLVMTPGPVRGFGVDRGDQLMADEAYLPNVDPGHYPNRLATDAEGRITLPALIPGAPYRISDWSTANVPKKGIQLRKDFTVKAGETIDLGDVLVEKPGE